MTIEATLRDIVTEALEGAEERLAARLAALERELHELRLAQAAANVRQSAPARPGLLRVGEVVRLTGLSRATIYEREKRGAFPRRRQVGAASVAWDEAEVVAWMQNLEVA